MKLALSRWVPPADASLEAAMEALEANDPEDRLHLTAAVLSAFCAHVFEGAPIDRWMLEEIAGGFSLVLRGLPWHVAFELPGRRAPEPQGTLDPMDLRDFRIYCGVVRRIECREAVVAAIRQVAQREHVSFETARAAYYRWKSLME